MLDSLKDDWEHVCHWTTLIRFFGNIILLSIPFLLNHFELMKGWPLIGVFASVAILMQLNGNWMRSIRNRAILR